MRTKTLIEYGVYDVTAKDDSVPILTDKQDFVDILDLKKDNIQEIKYSTLEKNYFLLDGSFKNMNGTEESIGIWSKSMTDSKGNFTTPLILTINFENETHSSLGLTLRFSELNYCTHLKVQYYDINNVLISQKEFYPNNSEFFCEDTVIEYKKIVITFYSTNNPYRYLKLYQIDYGKIIQFTGDNLMNANLVEELNLLSDELSINTLDFTIYSQDDNFNILNPQGMYSALQERQQLRSYKIADNKKINMGTFYLDTWKNEKYKTMNFTAIDVIGLLDKTEFMGGMYNSTFESVIEEIMTSAGLTSTDYEIQEELKGISVVGYMPVCTHREALQQLLFVVGGVANSARSDKIKIYKVTESNNPNKISKSNILKGTKEIEQGELVTGVSVTSHNYVQSNEEISLFEGVLGNGTHQIVFSEPVYNLSCVNASILSSNANYALIEVNSSSNVIIKGYKYKNNMQTFIVEIQGLNSTSKRNVLKIESDYLINNNNAHEIAERVLNYYKKTYITKFDFILDDEKSGDNVVVEGDFNNELNGYATKLNIDMTGGYITSAEIIAKVREIPNG